MAIVERENMNALGDLSERLVTVIEIWRGGAPEHAWYHRHHGQHAAGFRPSTWGPINLAAPAEPAACKALFGGKAPKKKRASADRAATS